MSGFEIVGTGRHLPGRPYTNHDLARVMDTNHDWIVQRTGIEQRHYCPEGVGVSDLAFEASKAALEDAGLSATDIDYIVFNTMTPDHVFPGSGSILGAKLGIPGVPALDLRMQCAAMLFSLQLVDSLLTANHVRRLLVVGAEAHAGFMPWRDWDILEGQSDRKPSDADWDRATRHRGLAVIFGDGAGAVVIEKSDRAETGLLGLELHSDGRRVPDLRIPAGFRTRPFISQETLENDSWIPSMEGRGVFKYAVRSLPKAIEAACGDAGVTTDDIDWFVAHQANQRINDAVRDFMGLPPDKMPANISRYGNTSTATIPILLDEMRRDGRLQAGQLVCMFALGAGLHYGAAVLRT